MKSDPVRPGHKDEVSLGASSPVRNPRVLSAAERARLHAYADAQTAEEAANRKRMRRLLAIITRNGRADGEDQAELLFQLTRGRRRLPAGNIAATMVLAGQLARKARRRVLGKSGSSGGRRWSKGLHPGLWHDDEKSTAKVPAFQAITPEPTTPITVGIVAVR